MQSAVLPDTPDTAESFTLGALSRMHTLLIELRRDVAVLTQRIHSVEDRLTALTSPGCARP